MNNIAFVGKSSALLSEVRVSKLTKIRRERQKRPKYFYLITILVILFTAYFVTKAVSNSKTVNETRLNELSSKIMRGELLHEVDYNELCELLGSVRGLKIKDCDSCRNYAIALAGGAHEVFLDLYSNKTEKELIKGIRSFQKQIELHLDKILFPEKHISEWKSLDIRQQRNLKEIKWNSDIKRLREQKEILECILKNR